METSNPLFHLSAKRNTGIRVSVTGSGASPDIKVTAQVGGTVLGSVCLPGPANLPTAVDQNTISTADSFVGNLPASWVVPGLELRVNAGNSNLTIPASELKVGPEPVLTFITSDWLLWGDTQATTLPSNFGNEFASRWPISGVQYSKFPITFSLNQLPISPRGDGHAPNGDTVSMPALIANEKPHCGTTDKAANTCTAWSGFGVLAAVRSLTGEIQNANGMSSISHWYGALGKNSRVGGGLGGGVVASGDNYDLVFNHEFGHSFNQPHWGDALYSRTTSTSQIHPYTGQYQNSAGESNGGGFGNSWAFDPSVPGYFQNPVCPVTGLERQEPMQRKGNACVPSGQTYDYFSDYSSLSIHRYFNGAKTVYKGNIFSPRDVNGNNNPPFAFPTRGGRPNTLLNADGSASKIQNWDETTASYVDETPSLLGQIKYDATYPQQWNVPVYTLWGSFSNTTDAANTIQQPMKYRGNLPRVFDPTNSADFADIKSSANSGVFWYGADLVVKAEFDNGTIRHALMRKSERGTDPLNGNSFTYWAVNIPVVSGAKLIKVSLYNRPMEVRNSDGGKTTSTYYTATNLNSTLNAGVTAANYMASANLIKTLTLPSPF